MSMFGGWRSSRPSRQGFAGDREGFRSALGAWRDARPDVRGQAPQQGAMPQQAQGGMPSQPQQGGYNTGVVPPNAGGSPVPPPAGGYVPTGSGGMGTGAGGGGTGGGMQFGGGGSWGNYGWGGGGSSMVDIGASGPNLIGGPSIGFLGDLSSGAPGDGGQWSNDELAPYGYARY